MADEEKNKPVDRENIILTGSASHGFGKEDFEEELAFGDDEDDEDDEEEKTVEDG